MKQELRDKAIERILRNQVVLLDLCFRDGHLANGAMEKTAEIIEAIGKEANK